MRERERGIQRERGRGRGRMGEGSGTCCALLRHFNELHAAKTNAGLKEAENDRDTE